MSEIEKSIVNYRQPAEELHMLQPWLHKLRVRSSSLRTEMTATQFVGHQWFTSSRFGGDVIRRLTDLRKFEAKDALLESFTDAQGFVCFAGDLEKEKTAVTWFDRHFWEEESAPHACVHVV